MSCDPVVFDPEAEPASREAFRTAGCRAESPATTRSKENTKDEAYLLRLQRHYAY